MGKYIGNIVTDGGPTGYSCKFNGSSDYLSLPDNTALEPGSSDLTWEMWINTTNSTQYATLYSRTTASFATGMWSLMMNLASSTAGDVGLYVADYSLVGPLLQTTGVNVRDGAWHHIAVVRNGSAWTLYVDGTSRATGTWAGSVVDIAGGPNIGRDQFYGRYFNGYISNLRVVKGTAAYTSSFTPPTQLFVVTNTSLLACQQPSIIDASSNNFTITNNGAVTVSTFTPFTAYAPYAPAAGGASPGIWKQSDLARFTQNRQINMYDPYWQYNTLLLNGNGTNGAQNNTFLDSSANNLTITRTGTVTQGSYSPYGSLWSGYFSGSSQYLTWTGTALGSGDFTVECWVNAPAVATNKSMLSSTSPNTTAGWAFYLKNGTTPSFYNNAADAVTSSVTLPNNQWVHVAAVRSGTTLTIYLNGVSVGSGTFTSNLTSNSFYVASDVYSQHLNAYISNARHVVGTAVYTSNFTPSIVPLTAITNTTALVCNSNYFRDNSANKYAITVTGNPYTQRYSPFVQNAPYEKAYYSGSCYFNAATSYLTSASTGALGMGTGDFTLEMWLWPTAFPDDGYMLAIGASNSVTLEIRIGWVAVHLYDGAHSDFHFQDLVPKYGQWQHFAVCRVGGTIYGYLNGVKSGYSVAFSANLGTSSAATIMPAGNRVVGYASDIRVSNTALYTATFTPPTTPATATTSTALLLQGTNAGITDSAAISGLITVGNVQISTTQSKYGGASMYFPASGSYLNFATSGNALWAFGAGDFTIEAWVYPTSTFSTTSGAIIFDQRNLYNTTTGICFAIENSSNNVGFRTNNNIFYSGSGVAPINTWTHVALVKNSNTIYVYVNGVQSTSLAYSTVLTDTNADIGRSTDTNANYNFLGYIDDLRVTKGVARYTANFTPPTSQLQNC